MYFLKVLQKNQSIKLQNKYSGSKVSADKGETDLNLETHSELHKPITCEVQSAKIKEEK